MYKTIPVLILCLCALTNAVYQTCSSPKGQVDVKDIVVSGCQREDNVCILRRNTNVSIEFDFTAVEQVQKVEAVVHGILMNVPVPFEVPNKEVCEHSDVTGVHCPLTPGQANHYLAILPVLKSYPKVNVQVKWELKDGKENVLACILIDVKIK